MLLRLASLCTMLLLFAMLIVLPGVADDRISFVSFKVLKATDSNATQYSLSEEVFNKCFIEANKVFGNKTLIKDYQRNNTLATYVFYSDTANIGVMIDNSDVNNPLELVDVYIDDGVMDPLGTDDQTADVPTITYPSGKHMINIKQSIIATILKSSKIQSLPPDQRDKKAKEIVDNYLAMGGGVNMQIKFKNDSTYYSYRLIPEHYGFSPISKAHPITIQFFLKRPDTISDGITNIYYPMRYVSSKGDRGKLWNITYITKSLSFGPFLATNNLDIKGAGALIGYGAPGRPPMIGVGLGGNSTAKLPACFTLDAVELVHILFNPSELGDN